MQEILFKKSYFSYVGFYFNSIDLDIKVGMYNAVHFHHLCYLSMAFMDSKTLSSPIIKMLVTG